MKRRELIYKTGLGMAAMWALPAWAKGWSKENLGLETHLKAANDSLLAELVEVIIPETSSPGAKSLGVHTLMQKIIRDCNGKAAFEVFEKRLNMLETSALVQTGKNFKDLNKEERLNFLKGLSASSDPDLKTLYGQLKSMTIQGYTQSEYYLTNVAGYEWAPNRYLGCVKLK